MKLRHCPATVSAPASSAVVSAEAGSQFGHFRVIRGAPSSHWRSALWAGSGKVLGKVQVRRPVLGAHNPLAFRGERRSFHVLFPAYWFNMFARRIFARLFLARRYRCPGRRNSRRSGRCFRGQNFRSESGSPLNGRPSPLQFLAQTAVFKSLPATRGASYLVISATGFRQLETPELLCGPVRQCRAKSCPRTFVGSRIDRSHGQSEHPHLSHRRARPHFGVRTVGSPLGARIWSALCA